jgi:hypothetical protein
MLAWALAALIPAQATTITRASLDDLIHQSTIIVRGRVVGSQAANKGSLVYTNYKIQVIERWKGAAEDQVQVQVPGGTYNGVQQVIAGSPQLNLGAEYVFFLWRGPSGAIYVMGLSQGVLDIVKDASGSERVVRQPSEALALDSATGATGSQDALQMRLSDFSSRVNLTLKGVDTSK